MLAPATAAVPAQTSSVDTGRITRQSQRAVMTQSHPPITSRRMSPRGTVDKRRDAATSTSDLEYSPANQPSALDTSASSDASDSCAETLSSSSVSPSSRPNTRRASAVSRSPRAKQQSTADKLASPSTANTSAVSSLYSSLAEVWSPVHHAVKTSLTRSTSVTHNQSTNDTNSSPSKEAQPPRTPDKSVSCSSSRSGETSSIGSMSEYQSPMSLLSRHRVSFADTVNKRPTRSASVKSETRSMSHGNSNNDNAASSSNSASSLSSRPTDARNKSSAVNASSNNNAATASSSTGNSKSLPGKQVNPSSVPYVYTVINDIKTGTKVNVFGIVKYVRAPCKGKGMGERQLSVCFTGLLLYSFAFKKHDGKVVVASSMELKAKDISCFGWEVRRNRMV